MTNRIARIGLGLLGTGALALGLALPAGAHVTADKSEVPAGGYTQVSLTVPHGCGDLPTERLSVAIPEGILNAAPQVVAGWDVETTISDLDEPVDGGHGETQTERVSEIIWTAQPGNELESAYREVFTIGFQAPDTPGETLAFKTVQHCPGGETSAWTEDTVEGEEEPDNPAPFVVVGAAEAGGHGGGDEEGPTPISADIDEEATPISAPLEAGEGDGGGSSNGLAIVALIAGLLGLGAGGTALVRSNKS